VAIHQPDETVAPARTGRTPTDTGSSGFSHGRADRELGGPRPWWSAAHIRARLDAGGLEGFTRALRRPHRVEGVLDPDGLLRLAPGTAVPATRCLLGSARVG
jgi:hypothetical protein